MARSDVTRGGGRVTVRQAVSVLALGLAARAMVVWFVLRHFPAGWFFQRGTEMGLLAQSFLEGKGLGSPFGGSTGPTAFIAPAYPLFVAGVFRVCGSYSPASALCLMAIHVALNLVTILLMMQVTAWLANARTAVLAGVFWALSPPLIWMPTIFWETNFSCCILVASVAVALRLRRAPSHAGFLLLGGCVALAGLVNPALLPTLLAILGWIAYQFRSARPYGIVSAVLALVVAFSPWPIRNARVFHAFIPLRSTVGFEMWMGNRLGATGYLDESLFPTFNATELKDYVREGEVAYVGRKSAEARQYILAHPIAFVVLSLRRFARFWTGSGTRGGSVFYIVDACLSTFFGLIGIGYLARKRPAIACLCALPLLLFPLPYYITHAEFRYRMILDPLLTILAAYGVFALLQSSEKAEGTA